MYTNCTRILTGYCLWSIGGQTHRRPSKIIEEPFRLPWKMMTSSLAPTSQVYPLPDKFATTNTSLLPNAFKSPLFLAKNILRNQACCVSSRGKTPRYLTTLEISLPSMDHNLTHMQMKCWKRKDTDSSSMQINLPKFNNLPTCGVTEKKYSRYSKDILFALV